MQTTHEGVGPHRFKSDFLLYIRLSCDPAAATSTHVPREPFQISPSFHRSPRFFRQCPWSRSAQYAHSIIFGKRNPPLSRRLRHRDLHHDQLAKLQYRSPPNLAKSSLFCCMSVTSQLVSADACHIRRQPRKNLVTPCDPYHRFVLQSQSLLTLLIKTLHVLRGALDFAVAGGVHGLWPLLFGESSRRAEPARTSCHLK